MLSGRRRVALLIETSNRYGRDLLHGIHDWIAAHGGWTVRHTEQARLAPLPAWLRDWRGDGVIARVDSPAISRGLRRLGTPVVDVSAERRASSFPRVTIDNTAVAHLAVEHLTSKNLRSLGFCGDPRFLWSEQRGAAFASLLARRGLACAAYTGAARRGRVGSDTEMRALARWIAALPRPAGIFACYDGRAREVLEACEELGLAVPDEVAVLGVDNDEVTCDLCNPPLSSILPNARRTGFEAAALLARSMEGGGLGVAGPLLIGPVRVVERQSTDAVSVEDPAVAAAVRHIRAHGGEGLGVPEVARAAGVSRTLLDRRFRRVMGYSPHRLIVQVRVERVRQLLAETDLPVARIADLTGFESPSYLSAAFRRETGETPRAFRQRSRPTP